MVSFGQSPFFLYSASGCSEYRLDASPQPPSPWFAVRSLPVTLSRRVRTFVIHADAAPRGKDYWRSLAERRLQGLKPGEPCS